MPCIYLLMIIAYTILCVVSVIKTMLRDSETIANDTNEKLNKVTSYGRNNEHD